MTIITKEIIFSGEKLLLTNQRIIFWESQKTIILSDLHIGKAAHFRKSGIAISSEILVDDLKNLELLILHFQAEKVIIVGDLFHAGYNSDLDLFKNWRAQFSQEFILIKGNHDRLKCEHYENLGIICEEDQLQISNVTFIHEPQNPEENCFYISGHIHPGFVLKGKNERLRLPCFARSETQIILPAFSKFTGLDTKTLKGDFQKIVFTEGTIFEV